MTKAKNKKEEDKKEKESLMDKSYQDDQKQEHSDSSYCRETFQNQIGKNWFSSLVFDVLSWFLLTNAIIRMQFFASVCLKMTNTDCPGSVRENI